ncbi:unnamed protein product, partial [Closterium sp. NIES-54]
AHMPWEASCFICTFWQTTSSAPPHPHGSLVSSSQSFFSLSSSPASPRCLSTPLSHT